MNGLLPHPRITKRLTGPFAVVVAAALLGSMPVEAAPIRHSSNHARELDGIGPGVLAWERYVLRAPAYWRSTPTPTITAAVRAWMQSIVTGTDPTADPITEYLLWRRSVAPSRFDHYHPTLGPELQSLIPTPTSTVTTTSTPPAKIPPQAQLPALPPSATTTSGSLPPPLGAPAIPEPGTATIAMTMIASVACWRRLRAACAHPH